MRQQLESSTFPEFMELLRKHYQLHSGEFYQQPDCSVQSHFRTDLIRAGPYMIGRYSGSTFAVKREWRHVRESKSTSYFVRFPLRGSLQCSQGNNHIEIMTGQAVITSNVQPLSLNLSIGEDAECIIFNVRVPAHIIRTAIPYVDEICGIPFSTESRSGYVAQAIYAELVWAEPDISPLLVEELAQAGLRATSEALSSTGKLAFGRRGQAHEKILESIRENLSVQGITAEAISDKLGISPRLLHYRLQRSGISFHDYLWEQRIIQADTWLSDPEFRHLYVSDIAYLAGFKSPSHFATTYRKHFGCSPTCRRRGVK